MSEELHKNPDYPVELPYRMFHPPGYYALLFG